MNFDYYPLSAITSFYDQLLSVKKNNSNALKWVTMAYDLSGSDYHKKRIEAFKEKTND